VRCTLCWIDPRPESNSFLINKVQSSGITVLSFESSQSIITWLMNSVNTADGPTSGLKIVSNRFRPDDGGDLAGVNLYHTLQTVNSKLFSHIPFAIFCGNKSLVKDPPADLLIMDKPLDFINWILD